MSRQIPLTKGLFAIVDDSDYDWLNQWKWFALRGRNNVYYPVRRRKNNESGQQFHVFMARAILNAQPGQETDHINGDTLDHRRQNLRLCSHAENVCNRTVQQHTSRFKGVGRKNHKWRARINCDGRSIHLGFFTDEVEAAKVYDRAALRHHGVFARLNFLNTNVIIKTERANHA